jgi:spore coat polysaccharide biosynthesis predicted glycosyltransferase SpsG
LSISGADLTAIAIRTDGDAAIGLGHVRRCLALAAELASAARVRVLLCGSDAIAELVEREGFACDVVPSGLEATLHRLERTETQALIVDSYAITCDELRAARARVPVLVAIDDQGRRPLPVDLAIDPTPAAGAERLRDGTHWLLGPRFALLRSDFAERVERHGGEDVRRVLLILGGATPADLMATLVHAARAAVPDAVLDVIVGPAGDGPQVVAAALQGVAGVALHHAPGDLRALMLGADLAVTGGGGTVFELAATGTPAVGVELAANQRANLGGMAAAGTLVVAGCAEDGTLAARVGAELRTLAADPERRGAMSRRGRELVDGRGAARAAACVLALATGRRAAGEALPCRG